MKAISIWQPHASLLMSGIKTYETRSWKPWPIMIGQRIWIHASKSSRDMGDLAEYLIDLADGCPPDPTWDAIRAGLKQIGFKSAKDLPMGCLLGTAVLAGFSPTEHLDSPGYFGDFSPGRFAWRFVEHKPLHRPIAFVGQQGFFDVPEEIPARHSGIANISPKHAI